MPNKTRTNPIGPGTQNMPVNIGKPIVEALENLARKSGMTRNSYCVAVLVEAVRTQARVVNRIDIMREISPGIFSVNGGPPDDSILRAYEEQKSGVGNTEKLLKLVNPTSKAAPKSPPNPTPK